MCVICSTCGEITIPLRRLSESLLTYRDGNLPLGTRREAVLEAGLPPHAITEFTVSCPPFWRRQGGGGGSVVRASRVRLKGPGKMKKAQRGNKARKRVQPPAAVSRASCLCGTSCNGLFIFPLKRVVNLSTSCRFFPSFHSVMWLENTALFPLYFILDTYDKNFCPPKVVRSSYFFYYHLFFLVKCSRGANFAQMLLRSFRLPHNSIKYVLKLSILLVNLLI